MRFLQRRRGSRRHGRECMREIRLTESRGDSAHKLRGKRQDLVTANKEILNPDLSAGHDANHLCTEPIVERQAEERPSEHEISAEGDADLMREQTIRGEVEDGFASHDHEA